MEVIVGRETFFCNFASFLTFYCYEYLSIGDRDGSRAQR